MKLTTPMQITAADSESRTITGRIVAFDEPANASTGKVVFAKGSVEPTNVFLNLEHDRTRRIGKTIGMEMSKDGGAIEATFKISNTTAGTDALTEAMDGLRDGFSIELAVDDYEMQKDGTMKVLAGELTGVALVSEPAVRSARVSEVAASENEDSESDSDADTPTTEGETVSEPTVDTPTVDDAVEATPVAEVKASASPYKVGAQRIELTKPKYLEMSVRAQVFNDEDAKRYVFAADNTTGTAAGMIPTPQMTEIINPLANADRGMIDAISRGTLPQYGNSFELPKVTEVPIVSQVDENGAVTDTQLEASYITVTKKSFKGRAISTLELLENSNPEFWAALNQNLEYAYAKETDLYVTAAIQSAAQTTACAGNTAAGFLGYATLAATEVYAASLKFAKNIVVSPKQWANIMGYNDAGRPIYIASQPQNAGGSLSVDSLRGNAAGLNLFVSRSIGVAGSTSSEGDLSMVVVDPTAYTWYESARQQLRTNVASDGTVDLLYFGQGALATKVANGASWNDNA